MPRVLIIHWKPAEAEPMLALLRAAGYEAVAIAPKGGVELRKARDPLPSALVIDLSRLPSQGKAVAEHWRLSKTTRGVPLVFCGGTDDKVAGARQMFPDAVFTQPTDVATAVKQAIRTAPEEPVVRRSMSGYEGTPLASKLGLKPPASAILIDAPQGFIRKLEPLPDGVRIHSRNTSVHRVLLFTATAAALEQHFEGATRCVADGGGLWIIYPKQSSGIASDLTQFAVRQFCLDRGWVDYKICAVDETWTGLLFARRATEPRSAAIPSK